MELKINASSLKIPANQITSILNFNILDCLKNESNKKLKSFNKKVFYCTDDSNIFINFSIYEDIKDRVDGFKEERLKELIRIFMLNENILEKTYLELSTSELKKINLISALLSDKKIIILKNPSSYLDDKAKDTLIKELKRLKKDKTIIIESFDTEFALKSSDYVCLLDYSDNLITGSKYEIFKDKVLFEKCKLKVPDIILFINKVIELKGIKLGYRDNINDTVKDIYRNV